MGLAPEKASRIISEVLLDLLPRYWSLIH